MNYADLNKPLVSVVMITYKHEAFIAEGIERVLMQEIDFPVELIIADDCSPDRTSEIVQGFIDTHLKGFWIKYMRHKKNKGMMPNFVWAMHGASGKYIALCEGDDYWTDPYKLQKQVDFLEANSDYTLVCSNVLVSKNNHIYPHSENVESNFSFTQRELSAKNIIPTVSVIFRNDRKKMESFLDNIEFYEFGDYPLWLHLLSDGSKAMKLADATAVYRVNEQGIFSGEKEIINRLKIARNIQAIKETVELKPEIIRILDEQIFESLMIALRSKDWKPELMDKLTSVNLSLNATSLIKVLSEAIKVENEEMMRAIHSRDLLRILWHRFFSKFKR